LNPVYVTAGTESTRYPRQVRASEGGRLSGSRFPLGLTLVGDTNHEPVRRLVSGRPKDDVV
jgi:hypothetical protein